MAKAANNTTNNNSKSQTTKTATAQDNTNGNGLVQSGKGGEKKLRLMDLQATSADIWDKKYRLKDKNGKAVDEATNDTFERVATALSGVEQTEVLQEHWYKRFVWALEHGALPAGRIISNAGAQA